jgi:hypothetical protein
MSGITFIRRDWGDSVSIVRLTTTDTTATATAANYLTAQAANIAAANNGAFSWFTNDVILLSASDGASFCTINSTFTTLTPFASSTDTFADVMYTNKVNDMGAGAAVVLDKSTATTTGGAATINKQSGVLTTPSLTTASGSAYTITLTNSEIATSSVIVCQVQGGTNTTAGITLVATPAAGSATILVQNSGVAAAALNGTVILSFSVF